MQQTQLQVMLPPDIEQQIYHLFIFLATKALKEVQATKQKRYYTQNELKKLLNTGDPVIKTWVAQGLPYFLKGKSIMYDIEDVHEFINSKLKR